jgi:putative cell wall-binding protein
LLLVGTSLTAELKAEIDRLGATDVVLIGGTAAIPAAIETALKASYAVKRVSGANRYATAAAVAREIERFGGNTTEAYFVRGDSFADALAVSPFAYSMATPVLLVQTGGLPADTAAAIDDLGVSFGMIAGGPAAVSVDVEDDLETLIGAPLDRWAGANRYATTALVADAHVADMFADYGYVGIATGLNFADALGGGAAAGYNGGVLLLTAPASLSGETAALLNTNKDGIDEAHVFGGPSAVSTTVYNQITAILQ